MWFYLSFADDGFIGAAIVIADDIESAARTCWELGINPGGQVLGCNLPGSAVPDQSFRNRLLSRKEVTEAFKDRGEASGWAMQRLGRHAFRTKGAGEGAESCFTGA